MARLLLRLGRSVHGLITEVRGLTEEGGKPGYVPPPPPPKKCYTGKVIAYSQCQSIPVQLSSVAAVHAQLLP